MFKYRCKKYEADAVLIVQIWADVAVLVRFYELLILLTYLFVSTKNIIIEYVIGRMVI